MIRAPSYVPAFEPVRAYGQRFVAPTGPNLASAIGRALQVGGHDLGQATALRFALQSLSDDTAGRARALQDQAALADLVATHGDLQGGAAVAAQPAALDQAERIAAEGQATLGSPGMVAAYDQSMAPALRDAAGRITDHATRQIDVERQAVAAQELRNAQQGTALDWADPARFAGGLDRLQAMAGDGDAARDAMGGAVAGAVGHALSAGEPDFAAHILGLWGHSLTPAAYQAAIGQLGDLAQSQRMAGIFAAAAGGDPSPSTQAAGGVAIAAPVGAAVHPIAGGLVSTVDGDAVRITHPDGSSTAIGGLGSASVAPGDLVVPAHVIGSAGPQITLSAAAPSGEPADADALLRSAGGPGALIGSTATPRIWDVRTMLDRIVQRDDLSDQDRALAANLAAHRMAADHAQLAAADTTAGRSALPLIAAAPGSVISAAGLPADVAAHMTPASLAQVDRALRSAQSPAADSATGLRLALMQRQSPMAFAQVNLAPLVDQVHPAALADLGSAQSAIAAGQVPAAGDDSRAAILDALARHEVLSGTSLPDAALPAIVDRAGIVLRLSPVQQTDPAAIDGAVGNAIQSLTPQA